MSFGLDETAASHLKYVQELDADTAEEICKVAFQFLQSGIQARLIDKAAKRLEWPTEKLQQLLEALMEFYRSAARVDVSKEDLELVITQSLRLSTEYAAILSEFYSTIRSDLRNILANLSFSEARYKDMEWRFEVEIASRTLHNRLRPVVYLQLQLEQDGNQTTSHTLQMDIPTLLHVTEELEQALQDIKSNHAKRIMRHIK
ncbi:COMM domain-containing protein 2-like [Paramacrobiotus metropolitanus]|uniref:COMM domain-containing protein 2-like n=1 Tax=Paramacrobiotus metropolitanus TaxID=2943436 RepID=UPI002445CF20|nr:COMM domain-containing protein 2-like [Paramacrobiotus metropolitanus]